MNTHIKKLLRPAIQVLVLGGGLLALSLPGRADVTVVVTHSGPDTVKVGDSLGLNFSADVSGKPNANNECEIKNLTYNWNITVTGVDHDGNTQGQVTYTGSGPSISVNHVANNLCQDYSVSASCVVSYETSPECQVGGSSTSASDGASVEVEDTPCDSPDGGSL